MRKLDVSAINISNGMPLKSGPFTHLQTAYQEAISAAIIGWIGVTYDSTKTYILRGCINSGSGSNYVISSGILFFNGEVYYSDAATFTTSGSNVAVGTITTTYYSGTEADPVDFTDGTPRNIHQIRKIVFGAALSGSGASDFVNLLSDPVAHRSEVLELTNTTVFAPTTNYHPATKKYVDDATLLKVRASGTKTIGDVPDAGSTYTFTIGSTLASNTYLIMMTVISNGTAANDLVYAPTIRARTTTSFDVFLKPVNTVTVENINIDWIIFQV